MAPSPTWVARAAREAAALIFPSPCVVCDDISGPLCERCQISPSSLRRETSTGITCFSGASWNEQTAPVMRAFKEDGVTSLAKSLSPLLTAALAAAPFPGEVLLVPIPTRPAADRRRGYRPVEVLLRSARLDFRRLLRTRAGVKDQRELSQAERAENTQDAFALRRTQIPSVPLVLVDDVITTGATMSSAARTLTSRGAIVLAAVSVLNTPRRGSQRHENNPL